MYISPKDSGFQLYLWFLTFLAQEKRSKFIKKNMEKYFVTLIFFERNSLMVWLENNWFFQFWSFWRKDETKIQNKMNKHTEISMLLLKWIQSIASSRRKPNPEIPDLFGFTFFKKLAKIETNLVNFQSNVTSLILNGFQ